MRLRPVCVLFAPFYKRTIREGCRTAQALKHLTDMGWCPVFLPHALQSALDDHNPAERPKALECSASFNVAVHAAGGRAFVLPGRVSEGMQQDIEQWVSLTGNRPPTLTFTTHDAP